MPCAPLPREAGPRWTVFGIHAYHVDEVLVGVKNSEPGKDAEGFRHDYVLVGNRVTGFEAAFVLSGTKEAFLAWARDQVRGFGTYVVQGVGAANGRAGGF